MILVIVVIGFLGLIASNMKAPIMAQSDIDRLAEQLQSRLNLSVKDVRAQCTSDRPEPYCKEFVEAYANMTLMIYRAKFDNSGASIKDLKREFDKYPHIITRPIP
jgi:hypothetical protein